MSTRRVLAAVTAALAWAIPGSAAACPACLSSAFGDRSYTWPYLGLIMMPLVVSGIILGVVVWYFGWRPRHLAAHVAAVFLRTERTTPPRTPRRGASGDRSPRTHTETT